MNAPARSWAAIDPAAPAPVGSHERLPLVDAIRGFALLGIFVLNVGHFALFWAFPVEARAELPLGSLTRLGEIVSVIFVRAKFYMIFSFLFGLGFAMLMTRAASRGTEFLPLYRRRLAVLLGIGLVHMTFLWRGDIVTVYALLGFLLPFFARVSDRALLAWAAGLFVMPAVFRTLVVISGGAFDPGAPIRAVQLAVDRLLLHEVTDAELLRMLQSDDWMALLKYNLTGPLFRFAELLSTMRFPRVLGAFLLGMWAGRRGIFADPAAHRPFVLRVLWWGLPIGLATNAVLAAMWSPQRPLHAPARILEELVSVGVVPLALSYVAALVLLWLQPFWRRWVELFAPAGRMALTNYLAQSVIGVFTFHGVGLGLGGRVGSVVAAAIAVGVFAVQAAASALWLRRFEHGPVEWLWRSLTYGRRLPLRRSARVASLT